MFTVKEYLLQRLSELDVDHIFSVTADSLAPFLVQFENIRYETNITLISNTNELEAAYAANAYAKRKHVPGVIAVTHGVGSCTALNSVASSYVEQIPLIVINGSCNRNRSGISNQQVSFPHIVPQNLVDDLTIFKNVTVSAHIIDNPALAPHKIDEALLTCISYNRPVYLEVYVDVWDQECLPPTRYLIPAPISSSQKALERTVEHTINLLQQSKRPILWIGAEIQREKVQDILRDFIKKIKIPYATTMYAKGVISEHNNWFVGILDERYISEGVRESIANSDLILQLGVWTSTSDIAGGSFYDLIGKKQYIGLSNQHVTGSNLFSESGVTIKSFLQMIMQWVEQSRWERKWEEDPEKIIKDWVKLDQIQNNFDNEVITFDSFISELAKSKLISHDTTVLCDSSLIGFPASNQLRLGKDRWVSDYIWGSAGYTTGATVGVQCADSGRIITLLGDGCFQQHPAFLSTLQHQSRNHTKDIIIFVFVNNICGIDQIVDDPKLFSNMAIKVPDFNLTARWDLTTLAKSFQVEGIEVATVPELQKTFSRIENNPAPTFVSVKVPERDIACGFRKGSELFQ